MIDILSDLVRLVVEYEQGNYNPNVLVQLSTEFGRIIELSIDLFRLDQRLRQETGTWLKTILPPRPDMRITRHGVPRTYVVCLSFDPHVLPPSDNLDDCGTWQINMLQ